MTQPPSLTDPYANTGGPGWWQASDGKWYPPEQHPNYQPPPAPPAPVPAQHASQPSVPHTTAPPGIGRVPPAVGASADAGAMASGQAHAAPGWYPDPTNPALHRFWDGAQWSAESRPTTSAVPPPATPGLVLSQPGSGAVLQPGVGSRRVGKVRKPWVVAVLWIVTLGIYGLYWQYSTFQEMNDYSGQGIGGVLGLVLAVFLVIVNIFILPAEVANLYVREGREAPVTALTGLWILLPIAGFFVWLVKTQRAVNRFWLERGAVA